MENKSNFDKSLFATIALQKFILYYTRGGNVEDVYNNLLNQVSTGNVEGRKIIENCKNLFTTDSTQKETDSTQKEVDLAISAIRTEMNTTKGRNPTNAEITKWLIQCFPEEIFGVDKRTYDMSRLPAKGMLRTIRTPQGSILKDVGYVSFEEVQQKKQNKDGKKIKPPEKFLKDKYGIPIHIQFMGCLAYRTPHYRNYIYKHRITKTVNGIKQEYEKFTNIDIRALYYDKELGDVVVSELLSEKNLNRSNADDYIGEIHEQSSLKPGNEKFESGFYTYQITSKHALLYNGECLEAVRAYKQQEAQKRAPEQTGADTHKKTGDEPEV